MVNIRNAGLEDINAISSILASSWKSAYHGIICDEYLDSLNENHWVDFLTAGIKQQTIFTMVLEKEENIIGAAILGANEKEINLISFYLLPEKIGHGFGHLFYNGMEAELKRRGFTKCILDVLQDNYRAVRFYEAHGFLDTNKRISAELSGVEYTCNVLEKSLLP